MQSSPLNYCNTNSTGAHCLLRGRGRRRELTVSIRPLCERRLFWERQLHNLITKHCKNSWYAWSITRIFLHTQKSNLYAPNYLPPQPRTWYSFIDQCLEIASVPYFPCLKNQKTESSVREKFNVTRKLVSRKWVGFFTYSRRLRAISSL